MELTLFLSQVLGVYLIIMGVAIMMRKRYFIAVVGGFAEDRMLRMVVASFELLAGLFLVFSHNVWNTLPESIISLFGWMMILEATYYLIMSDADVEKLIKRFNKKEWYTYGGLLCLVLGVYLAGTGLGWF